MCARAGRRWLCRRGGCEMGRGRCQGSAPGCMRFEPPWVEETRADGRQRREWTRRSPPNQHAETYPMPRCRCPLNSHSDYRISHVHAASCHFAAFKLSDNLSRSRSCPMRAALCVISVTWAGKLLCSYYVAQDRSFPR